MKFIQSFVSTLVMKTSLLVIFHLLEAIQIENSHATNPSSNEGRKRNCFTCNFIQSPTYGGIYGNQFTANNINNVDNTFIDQKSTIIHDTTNHNLENNINMVDKTYVDQTNNLFHDRTNHNVDNHITINVNISNNNGGYCRGERSFYSTAQEGGATYSAME